MYCIIHYSEFPAQLTENLDFEDPSNLFVGNEYCLSVDAVDKNDTTLKGSSPLIPPKRPYSNRRFLEVFF